MHDCRQTQEKIVDLIFGELAAPETTAVLAELRKCSFCQAENLALEQTLGVYAAAAEEFMPGQNDLQMHQAKLLKRFKPADKSASLFSFVLHKIFFSSVRVPVPVLAIALLLVCATSFFVLPSFIYVNTNQVVAVPSPPTDNRAEIVQDEKIVERIVEKPVEITVVKERIVRQKVFVVKNAEIRNREKPVSPDNAGTLDGSFDPLNLADFKPIQQAALAVEKGVDDNEK